MLHKYCQIGAAFQRGLTLTVLGLVLTHTAYALDYDKSNVWFCGIQNADGELVNKGAACRDAYYHYTGNGPELALFEGASLTEMQQRSCGYIITDKKRNELCFEDSQPICQWDGRSLTALQCTPLKACADNDGDGWTCCPKGKKCVPALDESNSCKVQDCPDSAYPENRYCSDSDKRIHPEGALVTSQLVSIKAELSQTHAAIYNKVNYTNLKEPTVLTPLKITVVAKYCGAPASSFRGRLSTSIDKTSTSEAIMAEVEETFRLVKTDGRGVATYEHVAIDPLSRPVRGTGLSSLQLKEFLIKRIGEGEPIRLNLVASEYNEQTGAEEFPPVSKGVRNVIPYTNCMPVAGSGTSIHFAVRYHANLKEWIDTRHAPRGSEWDDPTDYVDRTASLAEKFFTTAPHHLLKDKVTWNVDLKAATMPQPEVGKGSTGSEEGDLLTKPGSQMVEFLHTGASCKNDTGIILMHQYEGVYPAYSGREWHYQLINPVALLNSDKSYPTVVLHETGHSFSGLMDEYGFPGAKASAFQRASLSDSIRIILKMLPNCVLLPEFNERARFWSKKFKGCGFPEFFRSSDTGIMNNEMVSTQHNILGCAHTLAQAFGKSPDTFYEQCSTMPGINTKGE